MAANIETAMLPITDNRYAVKYKNEYDQAEVFEGILIHPDLNGFIVFNVGGKRVLLPKDRVLIMRELEVAAPVA